jgi:hypothetical protein
MCKVVQRFRGELVLKAHRLVYHPTLGLRELKKKNVHDLGVESGTIPRA